MKRLIIVLFLLFGFLYVNAQKLKSPALESLANEQTKKSISLFRELLSIPNNALNSHDIEQNIAWCEEEFQKRNFGTSRLETETIPLLLAERKVNDAKKTVLIYLQVDGQPVDENKWNQNDPYLPVLKKKVNDEEWEEISWELINQYNDDWRVFGRSASDAKGPIAMFLAALDVISQERIDPNYNIKVIMDFEEELGSPNLPKAVSENNSLLEADMLIIFDGPRHISNKPTLIFGARGIATITLTTFGPIAPQHSGHFGNYAPNPALRLSKLLASMKDDEGRVIIPGFYEGVSIDSSASKILQSVPDDEDEIMDRLQLGSIDKVGGDYQEAMQFPSLNICGMQSGWINEQTRTIVPSWARAELDIRLVLESDPEKLIGLVRNHIEDQGFFVTSKTPTKEERMKNAKVASFEYEISYQSFRTDFNSEPGVWLQKALNRAFDSEPVMIRMAGGSIPISPFVSELNIPAVIVPTVNQDNNQHSPNENLRLGNYKEGIQTIISILTEKL